MLRCVCRVMERRGEGELQRARESCDLVAAAANLRCLRALKHGKAGRQRAAEQLEAGAGRVAARQQRRASGGGGWQHQLSSAIDRLVTQLDALTASTPDGTAAAHAAKLVALRKRVGQLSAALHTIQERLNRLHLAVGRLPAATLADLARQELHAPPPPQPDSLARRAGPLAAPQAHS